MKMNLFTREEVHTEMRFADDNKKNDIIIDVRGNVSVSPVTPQESSEWAVRFSSFDKNKHHYGVNASVTDSKRVYKTLLYGWLRYLKEKKPQVVGDDIVSTCEEDIISEIRKLLEK